MRRFVVSALMGIIVVMHGFGGVEQSPVSRSDVKATRSDQIDLSKQEQYPIDRVFFVTTTAIEDGYKRLTSIINALLSLLILIDLLALVIGILMNGDDVKVEVFNRILSYSIWIPILLVFPSILQFVRWIFVEIGQVAGGAATHNYSASGKVVDGPTTVLLRAMSYAAPAWNVFTNPPMIDLGPFKNALPNFGVQFVGLIAYVMVMIPMLKVVMQYFLTYIKFSVIIGIGALFMPWAVWKPTRFMTEKFISSVYAHAVELLVFGFLLNVGQVMFDAVAKPNAFSNNTLDVTVLIAIVAVAFIFGAICSLAPSIARDLSSGTLSATDLRAVVNEAIGQAAMGAATAVSVSSTMGSTGAAAVAGGREGFRKGSIAGMVMGAGSAAGLGLARSVTQGVRGMFNGVKAVVSQGELVDRGEKEPKSARKAGGAGAGSVNAGGPGGDIKRSINEVEQPRNEREAGRGDAEMRPGSERVGAEEKSSNEARVSREPILRPSSGETPDEGSERTGSRPPSFGRTLMQAAGAAVGKWATNNGMVADMMRSYQLGGKVGRGAGYVSEKASRVVLGGRAEAVSALKEIQADYKSMAERLAGKTVGRPAQTRKPDANKPGDLRGED